MHVLQTTCEACPCTCHSCLGSGHMNCLMPLAVRAPFLVLSCTQASAGNLLTYTLSCSSAAWVHESTERVCNQPVPADAIGVLSCGLQLVKAGSERARTLCTGLLLTDAAPQLWTLPSTSVPCPTMMHGCGPETARITEPTWGAVLCRTAGACRACRSQMLTPTSCMGCGACAAWHNPAGTS